uniref:Uncharacterized protein n=1 Tax=Ascaris lumbricoides TaxID=6252 RepID=A0A0M3HHE6_ASCLU
MIVKGVADVAVSIIFIGLIRLYEFSGRSSAKFFVDDDKEGYKGNDADTVDKGSDREQGVAENGEGEIEEEEANSESERSDEEWETDDGEESDEVGAVCEQAAEMRGNSEQSNSKQPEIRRVHFKVSLQHDDLIVQRSAIPEWAGRGETLLFRALQSLSVCDGVVWDRTSRS